MNRSVVALIAAVISVGLGCQPALADKRSDALLKTLTKDRFDRSLNLEDSSLDTFAKITTERGYQSMPGLFTATDSDVFIRAFINKTTGAARYQVFATAKYDGDWRWYQTVTYMQDGVPQSVDLTQIDQHAGRCDGHTCRLEETFGFEVPEAEFRKVAQAYNAEAPKAWQMRFDAKSGSSETISMSDGEIASAIGAVDKYRADHGLQTP